MDQLKQLQHLSLVNKVTTGMPLAPRDDFLRLLASSSVSDTAYRCVELENHLGISEKTLAEFVIHLAEGKASMKEFQKALVINDAEMPESLVHTIWNVIQRLTQV